MLPRILKTPISFKVKIKGEERVHVDPFILTGNLNQEMSEVPPDE